MKNGKGNHAGKELSGEDRRDRDVGGRDPVSAGRDGSSPHATNGVGVVEKVPAKGPDRRPRHSLPSGATPWPPKTPEEDRERVAVAVAESLRRSAQSRAAESCEKGLGAPADVVRVREAESVGQGTVVPDVRRDRAPADPTETSAELTRRLYDTVRALSGKPSVAMEWNYCVFAVGRAWQNSEILDEDARALEEMIRVTRFVKR